MSFEEYGHVAVLSFIIFYLTYKSYHLFRLIIAVLVAF